MSGTKDLWPDLDLKGFKTPRSILGEQATILSNKTGNVLLGLVEADNRIHKDHIKLNFSIVAPALNNYTYRLFYIIYDLPSTYPIEIHYGTTIFNVANDSELEEALEHIFSSMETIRIIQSLYAQSVGETPES